MVPKDRASKGVSAGTKSHLAFPRLQSAFMRLSDIFFTLIFRKHAVEYIITVDGQQPDTGVAVLIAFSYDKQSVKDVVMCIALPQQGLLTISLVFTRIHRYQYNKKKHTYIAALHSPFTIAFLLPFRSFVCRHVAARQVLHK